MARQRKPPVSETRPLDEPERIVLGKCEVAMAQTRALSEGVLSAGSFELAQFENQNSAFITCDVLRQLIAASPERDDLVDMFRVVLDWQLRFETSMWMAMPLEELAGFAEHMGVVLVEGMTREGLVAAVREAAARRGGGGG